MNNQPIMCTLKPNKNGWICTNEGCTKKFGPIYSRGKLITDPSKIASLCKSEQWKGTGQTSKLELQLRGIEQKLAPHMEEIKMKELANFKKEKEMAAKKCNKPKPGTILGKMLKNLGFEVKVGCKCEQWISKMNMMGPQWCRDHIDEIIKQLNEAKKLTSLWEQMKAGVKALELGYPITVRGLVERAISDSEKCCGKCK